jgi:8-oxo-dGTP pyrophosphatase MutT (NUDIX family)
MAVRRDGDDIVKRLEDYFRLSPDPSGLILPPDPAEHIWRPDGLIHGKAVRRAAVLIPIVPSLSAGGEYRIMLTLRTPHLRNHAGQVSLPGGGADASDRDIVHTALRETEEETHLAPQSIRVIGTLPALIMPSAYHVTPVVGLVDPQAVAKPAPDEVAEIFYVPTSLLLNPENYQINTMSFQGRDRRFMELQFGPYRIWGATAAILHYLAKQLEQLR